MDSALNEMKEISFEEAININGGGLFRDAGEELGYLVGKAVNYAEKVLDGCLKSTRYLL